MDPFAVGDFPCCRAEVVGMDLRAILLVTPVAAGADGDGCAETLGGVPIALLPAVGSPVVQHVATRLRLQGISDITVIAEATAASAAHFGRSAMRPDSKWKTADSSEFWRVAENVFGDYAQAGAELLLVMRLGAYCELDLDSLIQFHFDQRQRVTAVVDERGPLDVFVLNASRRNDAAFLFRHQLGSLRTPAAHFSFRGYVNRLRDARDLRQLVCDAFALKIGITPAGRQLKPGVWIEDGARVHRRARILAPAFIGARSRVRAAAVLTRGACLEHHCDVDCGTVIEDSTLLPYTSVGAGLDIAHAVVGFRRMAHLHRNVEVDFSDPKLITMAPLHPGLRVLSSAAALASYLPREILRGLFAPSQHEQPASLPDSVQAPPPSLKGPAAVEEAGADTQSEKFPADLAVARRYGDQ
jgi:NDP-sugar pyrophosphorylase family protein